MNVASFGGNFVLNEEGGTFFSKGEGEMGHQQFGE
jgi:hypothetical protein